MALILFLLILSTIVFFFYHFYYKRRNLPPGPIPLPFIGNVFQSWLSGTGEEAFLKWRYQYGPIFTYWLGTVPIVCVADYAKMMEIFVRDGENYASRFSFVAFEEAMNDALELMRISYDLLGYSIQGIISASGEKWREQRRFAMQILRDFGVGKNLMQDRILDEMNSMFENINAELDKTDEVDLSELVDLGVGSIINNVLFGYRMVGEKKSEFLEVKRLMTEHMKSVGELSVFLWMLYPPLLSRIPIFSAAGERTLCRLKQFFGFFERRIEEHRRDLELKEKDGTEESGEPKDFVEAFLKEMKRRQKAYETEGQQHYFSLPQCTLVCADLWTAGQESTSSTIIWGIAYLLNNQQCLDKLYEELDTVIGSDRMITVSDRTNLPYTNAVINEIQRLANLLPLNIGRTVSRDVTLDGYELPQGTCVLPQISAILIDEKYFPNAKAFVPERYLDENGKLKRCDELIPFSIGKRECLGKSLAQMELFLFIANIFNHYKISPGNEMPSLKRVRGFVVHCPPYKCRLEKRKITVH